MYSKKIKTVNIIFLTVIYLVVSCFGSLSFAVTSNTEYANVPEGIYYFENENNELYASDLDYYSVVLSSYGGQTQQRWELEYDSDGYYRIKNVYTGKYLTAPNDSEEGSAVQQLNKFSTNATQDRQLWAFYQVYLEEEIWI